MSATSTAPPDGTLRQVGVVHGCMNFMLTWADDPNDWEFKQFVSQEQLEAFAAEHNLVIILQEKT